MCQVLMNMLKVRKQQRFEEAVNFVLRNIRLGATIDGLVRKEKYELPEPKFQEFDNMFRVELFRNNSMTESEKEAGEESEKVRI